MYNLNWSRSNLTRQKLGTFCEYYAKMSLASYGMSIYTSEVDDHGIDFIAESKVDFKLLWGTTQSSEERRCLMLPTILICIIVDIGALIFSPLR